MQQNDEDVMASEAQRMIVREWLIQHPDMWATFTTLDVNGDGLVCAMELEMGVGDQGDADSADCCISDVASVCTC